jgi:voltage-gated potassium channel
MNDLLRVYASHRYAILFYSLLITLGAAPFLEALGREAAVLEFLLALNLLAGAFGFETGWMKRVVLILTVTALAAHFALPQESIGARPVALAFWTVIALLCAGFALRFALRSTQIDAEHIYAALSAYLLAGIFFGVLYHGVEGIWPGSFTAAGATREFPLFDAIYFSFVTLATLGYGDLVPVSGVARGLAVVEAVSGQLFLAVLIARLVSSRVRTKP